MNTIPDQQQNITTLQSLSDLSDTTTVQNISELSYVTINNAQSLTKFNDPNVLQISIHNTTQNTTDNPNQNDTNTTSNQNNTSTQSTTKTKSAQPSQAQQPSPRNYDPSPLPPQYATHNTLYNSHQERSSNTNGTDTSQVQPPVQFQTTTATRQPNLQILAYTPAQNLQTQNIQPGLTSKIFTLIHYLIILPLETFLGFHYKPFQLTHYHIVSQVQTPIVHNTPEQVILK